MQVCSVVAFSQTLRRYTSLNHLAQAARAVLQNSSQISQMLNDLNRVDFVNVHVSEPSHIACSKDKAIAEMQIIQFWALVLNKRMGTEVLTTIDKVAVLTLLSPIDCTILYFPITSKN